MLIVKDGNSKLIHLKQKSWYLEKRGYYLEI